MLIILIYTNTCRILHIYLDGVKIRLEFQEMDVSTGKTEVKQCKFVEFISKAKGYFIETYKSQNKNPIIKYYI